MVAERDHLLPILARIGVLDRGDLAAADGPPWIGHQRRVQFALDRARVRRAAPVPAA